MNDESRLAVLEVKQAHHDETLSDVVDQLKKLNDNVIEIKGELRSNKGFVAGMAFAFSLIGAFIGLGGAAIVKRIVQ